nr:cytochrome P450 716B1-like [Tanacetum cinerariifolium]
MNTLKAGRVEEWFPKTISKHGPIRNANLFTAVLYGTSANKFIYTSDGYLLASSKPSSITRIIFLSIRDDDDGMPVMSDEEITDNIIIVMLGGYDTTSILIYHLVEQEKVARSKAPGESLKWEDLSKMKYTWRVASEVMRITPPVSLGFRRAKQDIDQRRIQMEHLLDIVKPILIREWNGRVSMGLRLAS